MKIVTKKGDRGETFLLSGRNLNKDHLLLEIIGTLDELNSFLGLARSFVYDKKIKEKIFLIQKLFFSIGEEISSEFKTKKISEEDLAFLEREIENLEKEIKLKSFVIYGKKKESAFLDIARAICRRLERELVRFKKKHFLRAIMLKYFNRLSDLLFLWARKLEK